MQESTDSEAEICPEQCNAVVSPVAGVLSRDEVQGTGRHQPAMHTCDLPPSCGVMITVA